jgi:hypothetical protein
MNLRSHCGQRKKTRAEELTIDNAKPTPSMTFTVLGSPIDPSRSPKPRSKDAPPAKQARRSRRAIVPKLTIVARQCVLCGLTLS